MRRGKRAVRVVGAVRGHNLTMAFAVSAANGLLYHELSNGVMNYERFCRFLDVDAT